MIINKQNWAIPFPKIILKGKWMEQLLSEANIKGDDSYGKCANAKKFNCIIQTHSKFWNG